MKKLLVFTLLLVLASCGQHSQQREKKAMSDYEAEVFKSTSEDLTALEKQLEQIESMSPKEIERFLSDVKKLSYDNDTSGMTDAGKVSCMKLEKRIEAFKSDAETTTAERLRTMAFPVEVNDDCLMENKTAYPMYLEKGDVLYYKIGLQKPGTVKLYNADARALLKTFSQRIKVDDSLVVANKGIYLVEIAPGGTQYADINITYRMAGHSHQPKTVKSEEVECKANDFRVVSNQGIRMKSAFEEPRKFTLVSQLKSTFSTAAKSRAVVAVTVPAGSTDILYSLRISTDDANRPADGRFPENMNLSYHKVRFLGLPLYESTRNSGLIATLLSNNRPFREEDAFCNMYVFRSQSAAKQFQDGTKQASQLQYDMDCSTLGTQSCNGRIPTKGARTIYLAFENGRISHKNYIWLEAIAATPITEYHTTQYTIE